MSWTMTVWFTVIKPSSWEKRLPFHFFANAIKRWGTLASMGRQGRSQQSNPDHQNCEADVLTTLCLETVYLSNTQSSLSWEHVILAFVVLRSMSAKTFDILIVTGHVMLVERIFTKKCNTRKRFCSSSCQTTVLTDKRTVQCSWSQKKKKKYSRDFLLKMFNWL